MHCHWQGASVPIQGGLQIAPSEKLGEGREKEKLTGVFIHYTFYTVFTHRLTFSFINLKYSYTPVSSSVVTGDW